MVANMSIEGLAGRRDRHGRSNSIAAGVSYAVAAGNGILFGG